MTEGGSRSTARASHRPKVSIITVVFNAGYMLADFLENVAPYRSADVELVILDGNSTDDTLQLLQQHNTQIDYWRSEPDEGIYDAMNKAVQFAKGQWLYFMGVDDRLLPGFTKMVNRLQQPDTIYYSKVIIWGEITGRPVKKYDLTKMVICHQSICYPASVFEHHRYNTGYKVSADHHLNMLIFADKRYQWAFVDELIGIYDTRGYSAVTKDIAFERDHDRILQRHLGWWTYIRYRFKKMKQERKQRKKQR